MLRLILVIAAVVAGCSPDVRQPVNPSGVYKHDVQISVDGVNYTGVAVLPGGKSKYTLDMSFAGRLDLFTLSSCHREITQEDAGRSGGIFDRSKNRMRLVYEPVAGIEAGEFCPIMIGGFEKDKGRHSWAFIDFETPRETMPAVLLCNGARQGFRGVSVCQSGAGLMQRVFFNEPMNSENSEDCPKLKGDDDGRVFDFYPPLGRCVYTFREKAGQRRFHRLNVIGYNEILIRSTN